MKTVNLVLILHNHQPVGNFEEVFEEAYRDAYAPFLEVLGRHPGVRLALHTSGSLLEWFEERRPEYLDRLREFASAGRVEIVGGAYYEPILTMLPRRDRLGQIRSYTAHLEDLFPGPVRGMWLAERVWEQSLVCDLADAGVEYTALDDFHFKAAGLAEGDLRGYYLTEDRGRLLRVFCGSERLRYLVPFGTVEETIAWLRSQADESGRTLIAYADDGEKFGVWPQTHRHVYTDGWLDRFFGALEANSGWLRLLTPAECLERLEPAGKVYLPDCSYREMTEWALPPERLEACEKALEALDGLADGGAVREALRPFLRGGTWRNFRARYHEANWMYGRMLAVSESAAAFEGEEADRVRRALYRAQCNCPYWHGVFGGLYLPHLREATYANLIEARALIDRSRGDHPWVDLRRRDLDLDGAEEVELANRRVAAVVKPDRGGHLVELDLVPWRMNLLATLTRRREAYHRRLVEAAEEGRVTLASEAERTGETRSIHEIVRVKEPGLERHLEPDRRLRESLIDHFLPVDTSLDAVVEGTWEELGDFAESPYECEALESPALDGTRRLERAAVRLSAVGRLEGVGPKRALHVEKRLSLGADAPGLAIDYRLANPTAWPVEFRFAVEFNFALLAGSAPDRYYRLGDRALGEFSIRRELAEVTRLELVDEWRDLVVGLNADEPAGVWLYPVETVSLSEAGFERVYQGSCVMPHWRVGIPAGGAWRVRLTLSAAHVREPAGSAVEP